MVRPSSTDRRPVSPGTGRRARVDTRQRILRATLRIIGEGGLAAVTNRRVAQEAGVSLGSLTYHFDTQQELLRESLLLFVCEETLRLATLTRASRAGAISSDGAAALIERLVEGAGVGQPEIAPFELLIEAGRDVALRSAARECFAAYDAIAADVLAALGVAEPERLAWAVVALIGGLRLRRLACGGPEHSGLADALTTLARGAQA